MKNYRNYIFVSLVVIASILIGSGIQVYKYKKVEAPSVGADMIIQQQNRATGSSLPNLSSSQVASWGTYVNSIDNYSISYPPSYHVSYKNDLFNFDETKYGGKGDSKGVKIQIQQDSNTFGFNLSNIDQQKQFIAQLNSDIAKLSIETQIKPTSLGKIIYSNKVLDGPGGAFDLYYAFAKDGRSYYRILVWGAKNDKNVPKILSSFYMSH